MIVVTNRLRVHRDRAEEFEQRFEERWRKVEGSPGFVRLEILRPLHRSRDEATGAWQNDLSSPDIISYEVRSYWRTLEDFDRWRTSDAFMGAHHGVLDETGRPTVDRLPSGLLADRPVISFHQIVADD